MQQVITDEIAAELLRRDMEVRKTGDHKDKGTVVKFFTPWGTASWFIVTGTPLDGNGQAMDTTEGAADWHLFGRCDLFGDGGELGYVLLSELQAIKGPKQFSMLTVERDEHYSDEDYRVK